MNRVAEAAGTSAHCCFASVRVHSRSAPVSQRRGSLMIVCAKKDIHPKYYNEAKVICNGEEVLTTSGTQEKYTVDIWSGNHPFYTKSEVTMLTDEGRVSRFNKRFEGLDMGEVPAVNPNDKKLEYTPASKLKGKGVKGKK